MSNIRVSRPSDFVEFKRDAILLGIHERIEEEARHCPNQTALRTPHVSYSYAEMNGLANSIGLEILSVSGKDLAQAAILQANEPEMIISILGALKAHKAYVPLDPNFPKDRLKIMVEDAEPVVLLTDDRHLALAEELAGNRMPVVNVSRIERNVDAPNLHLPCDPTDRAYILYTSGSTGRPRGIEFQHRYILHHTMGLINYLFFSPSDRVTWLHSSSFAASIVDIYCCLMAGGTLYPWDAKTQGFTGLADWLVRERVTTFQWIPSAFRQFLRTVPDDFVFNDIRLVVMASEPLTVREVGLFRRHFPEGSHMVNQVGTSESGNYRLYAIDHHVAIGSASVPGGYSPSEDRAVLILDDERCPQPPGTIGEIGIQSEYMCAGYWRDEELSQSKFVRIGAHTAPVYLTGDLGMLATDGCLTHLGRKDFQVKIRGHRVELAEVDHLLTNAPGVADAASWIVKNRLDEDQLVGYVVLNEGARLDQQAIEEYLHSRLPHYMVPGHYVALDRLPTLPTGKTDRKSLPNPFDAITPRSPAIASMASGEQAVAGLFAELLRMDDVLPGTNFMDAGGDSLLTAVLLERVHQGFGVTVALTDFLQSPTPAHLNDLIGDARNLRSGDYSGEQARPRKETTSSPSATPPIVTRYRHAVSADGSVAQKDLIIISAGGFGREVFEWATQAIAAGAPYRIKGFLDSRPNALAGFDNRVGILDMAAYAIQEGDVFVGALGDPKDKIKYYSPIVERGGRFVNIVHPAANVAANARLGIGIVVGPFSAINADATVGDHVAIGTFSNIGHDAVVGNWCHVASHCGVNGRAVAGEAVFLGSHSCVLPGVTVGNSAFVGAGSIVVRDVPPRVKVFGNPAAAIGTAR